MPKSWLLLALSLAAVVTTITLDILHIELGPESLSYLRMFADMALGAGLGLSAKSIVDQKSAAKAALLAELAEESKAEGE